MMRVTTPDARTCEITTVLLFVVVPLGWLHGAETKGHFRVTVAHFRNPVFRVLMYRLYEALYKCNEVSTSLLSIAVRARNVDGPCLELAL
jgi:hypothetical protein